jgi:hypothetical protein
VRKWLTRITRTCRHGGGRKAQCKQNKHPLGRWPKKSAEMVYGLLKNAESNAEVKVRTVELLCHPHPLSLSSCSTTASTVWATGEVPPLAASQGRPVAAGARLCMVVDQILSVRGAAGWVVWCWVLFALGGGGGQLRGGCVAMAVCSL